MQGRWDHCVVDCVDEREIIIIHWDHDSRVILQVRRRIRVLLTVLSKEKSALFIRVTV